MKRKRWMETKKRGRRRFRVASVVERGVKRLKRRINKVILLKPMAWSLRLIYRERPLESRWKRHVGVILTVGTTGINVEPAVVGAGDGIGVDFGGDAMHIETHHQKLLPFCPDPHVEVGVSVDGVHRLPTHCRPRWGEEADSYLLDTSDDDILKGLVHVMWVWSSRWNWYWYWWKWGYCDTDCKPWQDMG